MGSRDRTRPSLVSSELSLDRGCSERWSRVLWVSRQFTPHSELDSCRSGNGLRGAGRYERWRRVARRLGPHGSSPHRRSAAWNRLPRCRELLRSLGRCRSLPGGFTRRRRDRSNSCGRRTSSRGAPRFLRGEAHRRHRKLHIHELRSAVAGRGARDSESRTRDGPPGLSPDETRRLYDRPVRYSRPPARNAGSRPRGGGLERVPMEWNGGRPPSRQWLLLVSCDRDRWHWNRESEWARSLPEIAPRKVAVKFERLHQPLLPFHEFRRRMGRFVLAAFGLVLVSLALGAIGYHFICGLPWVDS